MQLEKTPPPPSPPTPSLRRPELPRYPVSFIFPVYALWLWYFIRCFSSCSNPQQVRTRSVHLVLDVDFRKTSLSGTVEFTAEVCLRDTLLVLMYEFACIYVCACIHNYTHVHMHAQWYAYATSYAFVVDGTFVFAWSSWVSRAFKLATRMQYTCALKYTDAPVNPQPQWATTQNVCLCWRTQMHTQMTINFIHSTRMHIHVGAGGGCRVVQARHTRADHQRCYRWGRCSQILCWQGLINSFCVFYVTCVEIYSLAHTSLHLSQSIHLCLDLYT